MWKIHMFVMYAQPPNFFLHTDRYHFTRFVAGGNGLQFCRMRRPSVERVICSDVAKWTFRADWHIGRRLPTLAIPSGGSCGPIAVKLAEIKDPDDLRGILLKYLTCGRNSTR
jgi:hypothetical protein